MDVVSKYDAKADFLSMELRAALLGMRGFLTVMSFWALTGKENR